MTALVALTTRLALARVAVLVPGGPIDMDTLSSVVQAGVDLLILGGTDDVAADVDVLRAVRQRCGATSLLVGTSSTEVAVPAAADVVHLRRPGWRFWGYPKGHQWSLLGRHAGESAIVTAPGADFDYVFVGPLADADSSLLRAAVERQPPLTQDAVPWFAFGNFQSADVDACLAAGARRIALTADVWDRADAAEVVAETAEAVRRAWTRDERSVDYRAAAFRR
ncbi:hypothetical protein [Tessaracoccus sp.]